MSKLRESISDFRKGIARRSGENFVVFVASADMERAVELTAPMLGYFADPFIWQHEGKAYLFCERFSYWRNKAHLLCFSLDENLQPVASYKIATGRGHVSFPYLIEDGGVLYMIPETREEGGIHLYRCDRFPDKWTRVITMVPDIDAVDTVVFRNDERWWMITSIVIPGHPDRRYLAAFFADSLNTESWQSHPINQEMIYSMLPYGSGRNAGSVVRSSGRLFRPSQRNFRYYGEAIDWMEITTLTPTRFVEGPLTAEHPLVRFAEHFSMHHFTISGDLVAWDIRDKVWDDQLDSELKNIRAGSASTCRAFVKAITTLH